MTSPYDPDEARGSGAPFRTAAPVPRVLVLALLVVVVVVAALQPFLLLILAAAAGVFGVSVLVLVAFMAYTDLEGRHFSRMGARRVRLRRRYRAILHLRLLGPPDLRTAGERESWFSSSLDRTVCWREDHGSCRRLRRLLLERQSELESYLRSEAALEHALTGIDVEGPAGCPVLFAVSGRFEDPVHRVLLRAFDLLEQREEVSLEDWDRAPRLVLAPAGVYAVLATATPHRSREEAGWGVRLRPGVLLSDPVDPSGADLEVVVALWEPFGTEPFGCLQECVAAARLL